MCQTSVETLLLQQLVLPAIEEDALGLFHARLLSVIHRTRTLIKITAIQTHLEVQDQTKPGRALYLSFKTEN